MHPDNRWTPGADPNSHLQLTWMEIEHGRGHLEIGTQLGCEGIVKVARGHVKLHPRDVGELQVCDCRSAFASNKGFRESEGVNSERQCMGQR